MNEGLKSLFAVIALVLIFLVSGCGLAGEPPADNPGDSQAEVPGRNQEPEVAPEPGREPAESGNEAAIGPYAPNEAGQVMILMYHNIGEPEDDWTRTPANFRRDLELLYQQGYRPVRLADYARGRIDLPRGYSPVILTFDDASAGQFRCLEESGQAEVDPQSAVGILLEFAAAHPDFKPAATFFSYYPAPFRQRELIREKYQKLLEWGMDIGNHTAGHQNLGEENDQGVRQALAGHVKATAQYLPDYTVETLALPYGTYPHNRQLAVQGEYEGVSYHNVAVLKVGANPAPSPYSKEFDAAALPRIRASEPYLSQWLDYFDRHPQERYVSDGDPENITVAPAAAKSPGPA